MTYTHNGVVTSEAQTLSTELSDTEQASVLSALVGNDTDDIFDFLHDFETGDATVTDSSSDSVTIETDYATYDIPLGRVPEHDLVSPKGADDDCHITIGDVLTLTTPFKTLPRPVRDAAHDAATHKLD